MDGLLARHGFATRVPADGVSGERMLSIPGARAFDTWKALRALWSESELWPVLTGPPSSPPDPALLAQAAAMGFKISSAAVPRWSDADRDRTLAAARALDPDKLLERWSVTYSAPAPDDPVEEASVSTRPRLLELLGSLLGLDHRAPPFQFCRDEKTGSFHEVVEISLHPTRSPWEVPALRGYGGWNQCPAPEEHVAMLARWHERFGAELVGIAGDRVELMVSRPPRTRGTARRLAAEHVAYCGDLLQNYDSVDELASFLLGSSYWSFWWD